jgi:hypothetical protein
MDTLPLLIKFKLSFLFIHSNSNLTLKSNIEKFKLSFFYSIMHILSFLIKLVLSFLFIDANTI